MRLLFLFVLLINGLIYLWYTVNSEPAQAMPAIVEPDAPRLMLLSEQGLLPEVQVNMDTAEAVQAESKDQTVSKTSKKADSPETHCFTLGPFMNTDSADEASRGLMNAGRPFEKRASKIKEIIGYWVMIPPLENEAEAQAKIQELKLIGDKHHYIVRAPAEEKFAIALGVFKSRENAERRHTKMKNYGYNVKLEGRYRQDPVYWLDYTEQENYVPLDLGQFIGAQRLPRSCEAIASNQAIP